jgi:ribulose-phosphate 3-epimerase
MLSLGENSAAIEVDGGVDASNAGPLVESGATMLVAGASIFGAPDAAEATRTLRRAAEAAFSR